MLIGASDFFVCVRGWIGPHGVFRLDWSTCFLTEYQKIPTVNFSAMQKAKKKK